jgi:hypothetical protein
MNLIDLMVNENDTVYLPNHIKNEILKIYNDIQNKYSQYFNINLYFSSYGNNFNILSYDENKINIDHAAVNTQKMGDLKLTFSLKNNVYILDSHFTTLVELQEFNLDINSNIKDVLGNNVTNSDYVLVCGEDTHPLDGPKKCNILSNKWFHSYKFNYYIFLSHDNNDFKFIYNPDLRVIILDNTQVTLHLLRN